MKIIPMWDPYGAKDRRYAVRFCLFIQGERPPKTTEPRSKEEKMRSSPKVVLQQDNPLVFCMNLPRS